MAKRSFGYIRKLPSKKFQASYLSPSKKRVNAPYTFLTRADANAWLSQEEVKLTSGKWEDPALAAAVASIPHRFEEYVERHIRLQTTRDGALLRSSTKTLYMRLLRVNLRPFWGRSIESLTTAEISEWWATAIKNGNRTISSKAYKLLSTALKRAVGEKLIPTNPCMVMGAQSAITGKRIQVPTQEEVASIAANINPRYSRMVILMAFGGFRFGEITELRRKDVSKTNVDTFSTYVFRVERAVTLVQDGGTKARHKVDRPKSAAGTRNVVVSSMFKSMIDSLLEDTPDGQDSLLFPSATSAKKHLRHDVFMNSWRPALKRSGINDGKYSPHCLRHFAGSHLHRAGAKIPDLKEWLGDNSTSAVMRYVHSTGQTASIAELMGKESFHGKIS